MTREPMRPSFLPFQSQAELELLHLIHTDEVYPWNPAEADSDAYFANLEQELENIGWTAAELDEQATILAHHFDQMWATVDPVVAPVASAGIVEELRQQFVGLIPHDFVDRIVQRAKQTINSNLSLADQLIVCAQELLPGWGQEDLLVLARPFAYQMRGGENELLNSTLQAVQNKTWSELSGIEQARLTLALSRYAIARLENGE